MEKSQLQNIKSFVNSDANSTAESKFTDTVLKSYFDHKRKLQYADQLDKEFNIRKEKTGIKEVAKDSSNSMLRYFLFALLGILLAGIIYFFFVSPANPVIEPEEISIAYKTELYTPVDLNVRGNQTDYQLSINRLAEAYEQKDFTAVITAYQELKNSDAPFDLNVEQMSGIAYGSTDNYNQAIEIFKAILNTKESSFSNHTTVRYLLGLVYLLNEDKPNARQIFQEIKSGDYKYDEVQSILETL